MLRQAAKRGLAGLLRPRVLLPLPVAGVVLALGLFISFSLWRSAESDQRREARARLDASAGLALAAIGRRLEEYQVHLHGMQGLFVADDDVRYLNGLQTAVPAGETVSIIPAVAGG